MPGWREQKRHRVRTPKLLPASAGSLINRPMGVLFGARDGLFRLPAISIDKALLPPPPIKDPEALQPLSAMGLGGKHRREMVPMGRANLSVPAHPRPVPAMSHPAVTVKA